MDGLEHLIYASTANQLFTASSLVSLLEHSRRANASRGLTGLLLHEAGNFFQVLEGPASAVRTVAEVICADARHGQIVTIIHEPIASRTFGDWTMAFADVTRDDLAVIDGLNDFFGSGAMFAQLGRGRATKLVTAFAQGRWRRRLVDDSSAAHA